MIVQVSGPPCAGKTTYIRLRASLDDVVMDDELLFAQYGGRDLVPSDAWDRWFQRQRDAIRLHDAAAGGVLWVVRGAPEGLVGVDSVRLLNPGRDECHRRAIRDGRPELTHEWIDNWFDKWA